MVCQRRIAEESQCRSHNLDQHYLEDIRTSWFLPILVGGHNFLGATFLRGSGD